MRYLVRERIFGFGDDFWIETEHGEQAFLVDGKALRLRETFELKDPSGRVVATVKKKLLSIGGAMTVERDGETVATVRKKHFTPLREAFTAKLADGTGLEIQGDFFGKEYDIEDGRTRIARISRRWFSLRDTYAVDVADGADTALVLSIAVCVDRMTGFDPVE